MIKGGWITEKVYWLSGWGGRAWKIDHNGRSRKQGGGGGGGGGGCSRSLAKSVMLKGGKKTPRNQTNVHHVGWTAASDLHLPPSPCTTTGSTCFSSTTPSVLQPSVGGKARLLILCCAWYESSPRIGLPLPPPPVVIHDSEACPCQPASPSELEPAVVPSTHTRRA